MIGKFSTICGSSAQWADALRQVDRGRRLTLREQNRVLDTIVTVQDAEREVASRELQRRLEARKRGAR